MRRNLIAASLTAAFLISARGTAPAQAELVPVPVEAGFNLGQPRTNVDDRLDGIQTFFGADRSPWLRVDLNWWKVEGAIGSPLDWSEVDPPVDGAVQRGMRVLLILDYSPPWANGHPGEETWFPTDDTDWRSIVDRTVAHFGTKVQAYEVWNEPNIDDFGKFGAYAPVQRYWELVKVAYESVHAACNTCTVLAGGSAPARRNGPNSPSEWLTYAYAHQFGAYFDAVTLHPYTFEWRSPFEEECGGLVWQGFGPLDLSGPCGELTRVRKVMLANGDAAKRIWATEIGFPAGKADTLRLSQARYHMTLALRMWRMLSYAGPFIVYAYRDECTSDLNVCKYGVVDPTNRPKEPLYSQLRTALKDTGAMASNTVLTAGSAPLRSADGRTSLALQGNGDLTLTRDGVTTWSVSAPGAVRLVNQTDGNLVLYNASSIARWSTGTWSQGPSRLVVQDDGNLVLRRDPDLGMTWTSGTASLKSGNVLLPSDSALYSNGRRFRLAFQTDRNLVLYRNDGLVLWSLTKPGAFRLAMQSDGNLVLYNMDGMALWDTRTWSQGPSTLRVQEDGNIVLRRDSDGMVTWTSNTFG